MLTTGAVPTREPPPITDERRAAVTGGLIGGLSGLGLGTAGVIGASRRYPLVRHLTLPMKVFLVTSAGTFGAIVYADRTSRSFERGGRYGDQYMDQAERQKRQMRAEKPFLARSKDWAHENRYAIIGGSWVASMGIAMGIVGRNPYQTTAQKLVQARVYAQGLTVLVLLATAALEVGNRSQNENEWETVKVTDPRDPEHRRKIEKRVHHENYAGEDQWKDMVAAAEDQKSKREAVYDKESHKTTHGRPASARKRERKKGEEDDAKLNSASKKSSSKSSSGS